MPSVNRRRLFLLAGCGLLAALLAACSRTEPASAATSGAQVLRLSQRNEPGDLDPATAAIPDEFFIIRALSEGLVSPSPDGGAPLPAAAERWAISPDGLTYTFHLRAAARCRGFVDRPLDGGRIEGLPIAGGAVIANVEDPHLPPGILGLQG